jgi:hypothetical protein
MTDRTRRTFIAAGTLATFGSIASCLGNSRVGGSSLPFTRCRTDITYTVVNSEDLSSQTGFLDGSKVTRYSRSLTTTPPVPQLSDTGLKKVSKCFLLDFLAYGRKKVNAVKILYVTNSMAPASDSCATVEWAPNGDFSQASKVGAIDYTEFELSISKDPSMCQSASETTSR